jgi:hypothetical protein
MTDGLKPCPFCGGKAHMHLAIKDAEIARLREALEEIRDQNVIEISLDSDWPRRIARYALSPIPDPAGGMPVEVK